MTNTRRFTLYSLLAFHSLADSATLTVDATQFEQSLRSTLNSMSDGDQILLPKGKFLVSKGFAAFANDISLTGQGMEETIIAFKQGAEGAQGLLLTGNNIQVSGLAIEDSPGDGLVIKKSNQVSIKDVKVSWPSATPKGYGIYPVSSSNITLTHCKTFDATEAGLYVGQSSNVIVSQNISQHNLTGIQVENSDHVKIHSNTLEHNAIGIVVSSMPYLPKKGASDIHIHDNQIKQNNRQPPTKSDNSYLNSMYAGSGINLIAVKDTVVEANHFSGHKLHDILIASFYLFQQSLIADHRYYAYPNNVRILNNTFSKEPTTKMISLELPSKQKIPAPVNILWDGLPASKTMKPLALLKRMNICSLNQQSGYLTKEGFEYLPFPLCEE